MQGEGPNATPMKLDRLGVDANWGPTTDEVYQAIRESPYRDRLIPKHGLGIAAKSARRMEEQKITAPDRGGLGWRLIRNPASLKRGLPYLNVDANRWKTFAEKRLQVTPGGAGSLRINGQPTRSGGEVQISERYQLLADHWTSERCVMVEALGRTAPEWDNPRRFDNEWWDNLYNCYAMANVIGVREPTAAAAGKPRAPMSMNAAIAAAAEKKQQSSRPASGYARFRRGGY